MPSDDQNTDCIPVEQRQLVFDHCDRMWKMCHFTNQVDICRECGRTRPETPYRYGDEKFGEHLQDGVPRERLANVFYTCTHCVTWPKQLHPRFHEMRGPLSCGVQCETFVADEQIITLMSSPTDTDSTGGRTRVVCAVGHMSSGVDIDLTDRFHRFSKFQYDLRGYKYHEELFRVRDVTPPALDIQEFVRAEPRRPRMWEPRFVRRQGVVVDLADEHHIDDEQLPVYPGPVMSVSHVRDIIDTFKMKNLHVPPTTSDYTGFDYSHSLQWPDVAPMSTNARYKRELDVARTTKGSHEHKLLLIRVFYIHEPPIQRRARDVLGRFANKYCIHHHIQRRRARDVLGWFADEYCIRNHVRCSRRVECTVHLHQPLRMPPAHIRPTTLYDMSPDSLCVTSLEDIDECTVEDVNDYALVQTHVENRQFDELFDELTQPVWSQFDNTIEELAENDRVRAERVAKRCIWDQPCLNLAVRESYRHVYLGTGDECDPATVDWRVGQGDTTESMTVCTRCRRTHPETANLFPENQPLPTCKQNKWLCGWCRELPPEIDKRYRVVRNPAHCSVRMAAFHVGSVAGLDGVYYSRGAIGADPRGRLQIIHATYGSACQIHRDVTEQIRRAHCYQREQFGSTGMFDFRWGNGINDWIPDPDGINDKLLRLWYIYETPAQRRACGVLVRNLHSWYYRPNGPFSRRIASEFYNRLNGN